MRHAFARLDHWLARNSRGGRLQAGRRLSWSRATCLLPDRTGMRAFDVAIQEADGHVCPAGSGHRLGYLAAAACTVRMRLGPRAGRELLTAVTAAEKYGIVLVQPSIRHAARSAFAHSGGWLRVPLGVEKAGLPPSALGAVVLPVSPPPAPAGAPSASNDPRTIKPCSDETSGPSRTLGIQARGSRRRARSAMEAQPASPFVALP